MAEQQNYKKIAQRDITNAREYAVEGILLGDMFAFASPVRLDYNLLCEV
tara:strand:- start:693 stop:839 length:147 start_codon:yes stop_codon:yes gene_type:complete